MFTILKATAFRGGLLALLFAVCAMVRADVLPEPRVLTLDRGAQDPAVSNDGNTLAVGLLGQIWLMPIEGGVARQLTSGSGWRSHPAWSPDGRFLAYAYQHRTGTDLIVRSLGDGTERTIHTTKFQIAQIGYHQARREIFFIEERSYLKAYLWSVPTSHYYEYDYVADPTLPHGGGVPKQWTFGSSQQADWSFAFSPDGKRVALEHVGDFAPSKRELIILNLQDNGIQRLQDPAQDGDPSLAWTRDGQSLLYMDREEGVDHVTLRSMTDGATRRVFSSVYDGKQLALHPDGKSAVMVAGRKLFRLHLDTGRRTPIAFTARMQLPARSRTDLRIVNARLFDATGDTVTEHAGVDVEDGRITRVWTGSVPGARKKSMEVIDARGRFLMPGLMDSHYHYWRHRMFRGADLLAMGVTSIREPGTPIADGLNLRDAIDQDVLSGPRIYTLGPIIDGVGMNPMVDLRLNQPEAAAAVVESLHSLGVDGIKLYATLDPKVSVAVIAAAKKFQLPVTGHIARTTWTQAMAAGIDGLTHAANYYHDFVPAPLRAKWGEEPVKVSVAASSTPPVRIDPTSIDVRSMLREMAKRGVMLDPTLLAYVREEAELRQGGFDGYLDAVQLSADIKTLALEAYRAGVPRLVGTDDKSMHDELETLERVGVPNAELLRAATVNGARWLGRETEFGTVQAGRRADLLLIDGNPLQQMKDIRNVELVIKDGRVVFAR